MNAKEVASFWVGDQVASGDVAQDLIAVELAKNT